MSIKSERVTYIESHAALRGIAALTVLLDHMRAFSLLPRDGVLGHLFQVFAWGDLAVFLFFTLSGFVMSYVYPSPVQWKHFFVARLARLVPVYEVTLIFMFVLLATSANHKEITVFNVCANFLMIQQWLPVPHWFSPNIPSWSLSVEALLYIVAFPLLILTRNKPWKNSLYVVLIVIGILWGTLFYNFHRPIFFRYWYLPLFSGFGGFGVGFAIHSLMKQDLRYPKFFSGLAFILIACSLLYRIISANDASHGFLVLGLVTLVVCSIDPAGLPYRILARPFFLYLGDISYSLYLWHYPLVYILIHERGHVEAHLHSDLALRVFGVALSIFTIALALSVATLSYYKLEVPFRRLIRDRFVRGKAGAVLAHKPS